MTTALRTMTGAIRTLVVVDGAIDVGLVERLLGDPRIATVGVVDQDTEKHPPADVLLVACASDSAASLQFVARAASERPERPVIVACGGSPNGFVGQVLAAGADDIVLLDETDAPARDAFFAMQKALARRAGDATEGAARGDLICVLGPKGGIGKTLTSANLGLALAENGSRVVIVDLDLQFGDLGLALGLIPERTIHDLVLAGGTLDADKVETFLSPHRSGARVLLAPVRPDQAAAVTPEFLAGLFELLRASNDFVVVDTPPSFTPEVIAAVDASSSLCMIGMLDAPSLKNTKLGLETLELMGYPAGRIRIMLNRADTNVGITHADVVSVLGRAPDVLVPSSRDVVRSINEGEPIVLSGKRSEPAKALRALAALYLADRATTNGVEPGPRRRRRLGRS
ncbi:MAG: AAA family ATPase [Actinomycetota bacterium]|nr:AAA family ATPase [Actinomycetota bacterium]